MPAKLLTGKEVAQHIEQGLQREVQDLKAQGIAPALRILIVGNAAESLAYTKNAVKIAEKLGIACAIEQLPFDTSENEFIKTLSERNSDPSIHGILIMRPLPKHISEDVVKYAIDPEKDMDCLNPVNAGKVMVGDLTGFPPATPQAVMKILRFYEIPLSGKEVVVVGRSMVVGKPLSMLLLHEDATVTVCHSKTHDLPAVCRRADILIVAIGKTRMVTPEYIKSGATVIDVGINVEAGKLCGDVDTEQVIDMAGAVTPVPGGVGVVTTRVLLEHVVRAAKMQNALIK